jgi:hypothetical protein
MYMRISPLVIWPMVSLISIANLTADSDLRLVEAAKNP